MFLILSHWLIVLTLSPLFLGIISKVKAFFAGKKGPSFFQPYFDLQRLFQKNSVYSRTTTWIFCAAPIINLAAVLVLSALVPLGTFKAPVKFSGDILLAAYILGFARFFMISAALDTGSSFEGMGASREAFFSCLSELALFMNFITLSFVSHSISLSAMIGANFPLSWTLMGPVLLLVVGSFFIVILTENARIPIDDPDTHLELTMIHEVMILDHSGVDLGYMLYAAAIKFFVFASIMVPIIVPVQSGNTAWDMLIFLGGMLVLSVTVGIIESTMARLRLNRVNNLLLIAFALAFFGFVVKMWRM
ncbi:MAG: NADH-quinone oxidoreductase subunit H [Candidatus Omnitrophica bacterium]|nr:NADH-quinone oxidoreductase subunit H [Candidatus Omnitrophota bacterium]